MILFSATLSQCRISHEYAVKDDICEHFLTKQYLQSLYSLYLDFWQTEAFRMNQAGAQSLRMRHQE